MNGEHQIMATETVYAVKQQGRVLGNPAYRYVRPSDGLPAVGATEDTPDPVVRVKLFDPCGAWTWYLTECNLETGEAFGLVDGFEVELGYIDLAELAAVRGKLGLPIERDIHWKPQPLSAVRNAIERRREP